VDEVAGELALVLAEGLEEGLAMVSGYAGVEKMADDNEGTFCVLRDDGSVYVVEVMMLRGPKK